MTDDHTAETPPEAMHAQEAQERAWAEFGAEVGDRVAVYHRPTDETFAAKVAGYRWQDDDAPGELGLQPVDESADLVHVKPHEVKMLVINRQYHDK